MKITATGVEELIRERIELGIRQELSDQQPYSDFIERGQLSGSFAVEVIEGEDGEWRAYVDLIQDRGLRRIVYDLLDEVEEFVSRKFNASITIVSSPERIFEFIESGTKFNVIERKSSYFVVQEAEWKSPGPNYHAVFDRKGSLVSTGAIQGGTNPIPRMDPKLTKKILAVKEKYLAERYPSRKRPN